MALYNLSTEELEKQLAEVRNNILTIRQKLLSMQEELYKLDDLRNTLVNKLEGNQSSFFDKHLSKS